MTTASRLPQERRFLFDAHATTLRGRLTRPDPVEFDSSRTLSLALSGGSDRASDNAIRFGNVLSIGAASSVVTGEHLPDDDAWKTTITTTVEDLSILEGRLKARKIVAKLTEVYSNKDGDRTFSVEGSGIDGLVIEGEEASLNFDDAPFRKANWRKLLADAAGNQKLRGRFEQKDQGFGSRKNVDTTLCSLTDPGEFKHGKATVLPGGCIVIPNFGRIWLAELLATADRWRLTMFRAKLGSPAAGEFEIADTSANGQRYPP